MKQGMRLNMSLTTIQMLHREVDGRFFSPDNMRFFASRISPIVYDGPGGVFFVTSEMCCGKPPRRYSVRRFNRETWDIETVHDYMGIATRRQAHAAAAAAAKGVQ